MTPIETPVGTLYEIPASGWVAVSFPKPLNLGEIHVIRDQWKTFTDANPGMPKLLILPTGAGVIGKITEAFICTEEERSFLSSLADSYEKRATELERPGTWGSGLPKPKELRSEAAMLRNILTRTWLNNEKIRSL